MTEWAETARTRQGLYRFFGGALLSPSVEQLSLLHQAQIVLGARDLDRFAFALPWRQMAKHFPEVADDASLAVEHVRLFASGRSDALSPPTESYYRVPPRGAGIAEFVASLQREYRSMGVSASGHEEAPDHISCELDMMARLCGAEADAWAAETTELATDLLGREERFLRRHLAVWVPMFLARLEKADPHPFYRDLVGAVHAFVMHERDYATMMLRTLEES